jgi:hypothetical protein
MVCISFLNLVRSADGSAGAINSCHHSMWLENTCNAELLNVKTFQNDKTFFSGFKHIKIESL